MKHQLKEDTFYCNADWGQYIQYSNFVLQITALICSC